MSKIQKQLIDTFTNEELAEQRRRERLAELCRCEKIIDDCESAPPRGCSVVYPAPEVPDLTALATLSAFQEKWPLGDAVDFMQAVLFQTEQLVKLSSASAPDNGNTWDGMPFVGLVRNLWKVLPLGRITLSLWGREVIVARNLKCFSCRLGNYPSVIHGVQSLAEIVLAKIWSAAENKCPGRDPVFYAGAAIPCFRVDWWYEAMPNLHKILGERTFRKKLGINNQFSEGATIWETHLDAERLLLDRRIRRRAAPRAQQATIESATDARGRWIYEQRQAGKSYKAIMFELGLVADQRGWETLGEESSVYNALKRWRGKHHRDCPANK